MLRRRGAPHAAFSSGLAAREYRLRLRARLVRLRAARRRPSRRRQPVPTSRLSAALAVGTANARGAALRPAATAIKPSTGLARCCFAGESEPRRARQTHSARRHPAVLEAVGAACAGVGASGRSARSPAGLAGPVGGFSGARSRGWSATSSRARPYVGVAASRPAPPYVQVRRLIEFRGTLFCPGHTCFGPWDRAGHNSFAVSG